MPATLRACLLFKPPCPNFRGSRSWLSTLGVGCGVELIPAPHSSVAVRHRQRREAARVQGFVE